MLIGEGDSTMITVITAWYNEEFLASLFLRHYSFADRIVVLLDEGTSDNTIDMMTGFRMRNIGNDIPDIDIDIKVLKMPDGMDDKLKQKQINDEYKSIDDGWVIIVDADEFISIPDQGLDEYLNMVTADVVKVDYFQMYQHKTEIPLNRTEPIFFQRSHGKRNGFERWKKPSVVRAGKGFAWSVGHHEIDADKEQIYSEMLSGAHLYMSDVDLAIERRIYGRKNRMSKVNYKSGLSAHNFNITEQDIIDECIKNMDCPKVF